MPRLGLFQRLPEVARLVYLSPVTNPISYEKTILCLAASRRPGGRCVAGKEYANGAAAGWVRPVNAQNHAMSESDLLYENGTSADVLDIVTIPMMAPMPLGHQQENHLINPECHWELNDKATWQQIVAATDAVVGTLWSNNDSSYHGLNDKVAEATANTFQNSLCLISPVNLRLIVGQESQYGGGSRRRVRASFNLNGSTYNFVVTDPWIETKYFARPDGTYSIPESRLCISLPEILAGSATKLVATVITPARIQE